jgi:Uma2 family endonuclease
VEEVGEIEGYWPGAPDLAVEVVSPNDRFAEVEEKVADWLAAGTCMVLVVNPRARTVMVRTSEREARILSEAEVLDGGEVVPGWTLPVADVFR